MEANELRIGNLITSKMSGFICVETIPKNIDMNRYEPIPITKEWLLKFGFESKVKGFSFLTVQKTPLYIYVNNNGDAGICIEDLNEDLTEEEELYFSIKLRFVHQLQNLYFALTNEELTIKTK